MAKKPLELQSLKWPFVGLAVLLALTSAWAGYDEVFARRPWKNYQREVFKHEMDKWEKEIAERTKKYDVEIAHHKETSAARIKFQQDKEKAQAAVDKFDKPVAELKEKMAAVSAKWPAMEQYWIEPLKNSWG